MKTRPDAYTALVRSPKLDRDTYVVSVLVMRRDGKKMAIEDLERAAEAYPATDHGDDIQSNPEDDAILDAARAPAKKPAPARRSKASKKAA